ncbi:MAG: hypothetical protein Q7S26_03515 [bacterium]|nr:hypothetical protein [bacterium]
MTQARRVEILGEKVKQLRYGENPHQKGAVHYKTDATDPLALNKFQQIEGEAPGYINLTDLDRLVETASRIATGFHDNFGKPVYIGVAVKHGNACGAAVGLEPKLVVEKMVAGNPEAIFGGSVLFNFNVDSMVADVLREHLVAGGGRRILDCISAPSFSEDAIEKLSRKAGKCRLFVNSALAMRQMWFMQTRKGARFRQVCGGFIMQDGELFDLLLKEEWREQLGLRAQDVVLAWAVGSTSNSNTIVLAKGDKLLGMGVAQPSRVGACKVAVMNAHDAGHDLKGAVAYSDSFFPFPDGPQVLADAGISVIFATSGSVRDAEVAAVCKEREILLLTLPDAEARGFYGH